MKDFDNQDDLKKALSQYRLDLSDNSADAFLRLLPEGKEGDKFKELFMAYRKLTLYNYLDSQMMQTKAWETNPNLMRMYYNW